MRAWDFPKDTVRIACDKCGRQGQYTKKRFMELVGKNTQLPCALGMIAQGCDRANLPSHLMHDRCRAHYPDLVLGSLTREAEPNV